MQVMDTAYMEEQSGVGATARKRLFALAFIMATTAALIYVRVFNPEAPGLALYPSCPFHNMTGLNCPGCGMTRGLHQLLHGHFLTALNHNALLLILLPILGYALASNAFMVIRGRGLPRPAMKPVYLHTLSWVMIVFWVLRNIPVYPLTLLSP